MKNIKPKYYGYIGNNRWTSITICKKCGTRALYEDRHPVDPCPDCGGKLKEDIGKFIPVVANIKLLWINFPIVIDGYWGLKSDFDNIAKNKYKWFKVSDEKYNIVDTATNVVIAASEKESHAVFIVSELNKHNN